MPLKVLVVGGGIAGLTAALAIGRNGHQVEIFEKSAFSNEVGAALHLAPQVMRVLGHLGVDVSKADPCACLEWRVCDWDQKILSYRFKLREKQKDLDVKEDENMMHRVDIHRVLRESALALPNVSLHLSAGVESADPVSGTITLSDGSTHSGDVVVGADGVHSNTLFCVEPTAAKPHPVGVNIYRFMVQTEKAMAKPAARRFLESYNFKTTHDTFVAKMNTPRLLVMYPCRNGTLLNCASFQTTAEEKVPLGDADYNCKGTIEEVLDLFEGWPEHWQDIFQAGEDVKHWKVISRKAINTFVKGKIALIGDAAHPTLPSHGAGAGMAIEDAGVLGAVLDKHVTGEDVVQRLELFNKLRFERATTVKCASEILGGWSPEIREKCQALLEEVLPDGKIPVDVDRFLWPVDVVQQARDALPQSA